MTRLSEALSLLGWLARSPEGWEGIVEVLGQLPPQDRPEALAWAREATGHWPPEARLVLGRQLDPSLWAIGGVLALDGRSPGLAEVLRGLDLTGVRGLQLRRTSAEVVRCVAASSDPAAWQSLVLELDPSALAPLAELPLDGLASLVLEDPGRALGEIAAWRAPGLERLAISGTFATSGLERLPEGLRTLEIRTAQLRAPLLATLAERVRPRLEALGLRGTLTASGIERLTAAPWPRLARLGIAETPLGRDCGEQLAAAGEAFPALSRLDLREAEPTGPATAAIAAAPWIGRLSALDLGPTDLALPREVRWRLLDRLPDGVPRVNDGLIDAIPSSPLAVRGAEIARLFSTPGIASLRRLQSIVPRGEAMAAALAGCPWLSGLEVLELSDCTWTAEQLGRVLANPSLRRLGTLSMIRTRIAAGMASALARSGLAPRTLSLVWSGMGPDSAAILAESPLLGAVEVLDVTGGALGTADLRRLLDAAPLLKTLRAGHNRLGPGVTRMFAAGRLPERLALPNAALEDSGAVALLDLPGSSGLRELDLRSNDLGDPIVAALLRWAERNPPIRVDLSDNRLSEGALVRLRELGARLGWARHGWVGADRNRASTPKRPGERWLAAEEVEIAAGEWALAGTFVLGSQRELIRRIRALGGRAQDRIGPETTAMAVGAKPHGRDRRAIERGIPLVTEDALYRAMGYGSVEDVLSVRLDRLLDGRWSPESWSELREILEAWPMGPHRLGMVAASLPADLPVRRLAERYSGWFWEIGLERWAPSTWMSRAVRGGEPKLLLCTGLRLHKQLAPEQIAGLLGLPELGNILAANLTSSHLSADGVERLARSALGASVRDLAVSLATPDAVAALARAELPRLDTLYLQGGGGDISRAPWLPRLRGLDCQFILGEVGERGLCERLPSGTIRNLGLIWQGELAPLLGGRALPALEHLALRLPQLPEAQARVLGGLDAPLLRCVSISSGPVRHQALRALLHTEGAARWTHLSLNPQAEMTQKAVDVLLGSPFVRPGAKLFVHPPPPALVARAAELRERGVVLPNVAG